MRLFARYQRYVYYFIRSLMPDPAAVEEVLQETSLVLWKKFGEFQPGSNFHAWACKIARLEVFNYRARASRAEMHFSDVFVEEIADEADESIAYLEARMRVLESCLQKMSARDREMIDRRYRPGGTSRSVARELHRPIRSVYKSLSRIRKALLDCVSHSLAREERA